MVVRAEFDKEHFQKLRGEFSKDPDFVQQMFAAGKTIEEAKAIHNQKQDELGALKKEFAESEQLQAEFGGDEKAYVAFKEAEKNGRVGLRNRRVKKEGGV